MTTTLLPGEADKNYKLLRLFSKKDMDSLRRHGGQGSILRRGIDLCPERLLDALKLPSNGHRAHLNHLQN
jgi:hypothetical protein